MSVLLRAVVLVRTLYDTYEQGSGMLLVSWLHPRGQNLVEALRND